MHDHIIVCGLGQVGYRIVELLLRVGTKITVITAEAREEWLEDVRSAGVTVLTGDARNERFLRKAGLSTARALIAATDQDVANIEIALDAKTLRPDIPVVIRLFDQILAQQLESTLDIRRALAMSVLAAPAFTGAVMGQNVIGSFSVEGHLFLIGEFPRDLLPSLNLDAPGLSDFVLGDAQTDTVVVVAHAEQWDNLRPESNLPEHHSYNRKRWKRTLMRSLSPRSWWMLARQVWSNAALPFRALLIGLVLLIVFSIGVFQYALDLSPVDAIYFVTSTITTTGYGDISLLRSHPALKLYGCLVMILGSMTIAVFYSILTDFIITSRFEQLLGGQKSIDEDHIILVGLGNVGFRIAEDLKRLGVGAVVIEKEAESSFVGSVRPDFPVFIGDARIRETLIKAGIDKARAIIAATADDAVNLSVSLAAKQANPDSLTVVRFFDPGFARKVEKRLGVDVAMSAASVAAPTFVAAALSANVRSAFIRGNELFAIVHERAQEQGSAMDVERQVVMRLRGTHFVSARSSPASEGEEVLSVIRIPLSPSKLTGGTDVS